MSHIITNFDGASEVFEMLHSFCSKHKKIADYSVTDLCKPPEVVVLRNRAFDGEINFFSDIVDSRHVIKGTALDYVVKEAIKKYGRRSSYVGRGRPSNKDYRYIIGKPRKITVNGRSLSGEFDFRKGSVLYDFKFISQSTYNRHIDKYYSQLNYYRYILHKHKVFIDRLVLEIYLNNWRETTVDPPSPFYSKSVELWSLEDTEKKIILAIDELKRCEKLSTEELIALCNEKRYSNKVVGFGVKRKGNINNTKVFPVGDDEEAALRDAGEDAKLRGSEYDVIPIVKEVENHDYGIVDSLELIK